MLGEMGGNAPYSYEVAKCLPQQFVSPR